ncbi:phosphotransferase family protein [Kineococcus sp. SYSU DK002]|uniref:phosphotransferase family protein n=1 Tax=Kineococcus sp. SYSU DK002 TaxID=3383123 RepID=UPI003D7E9893
MTRSARLPDVTTEDAFHRVARDESALRPGVDALADSLALPTGRLRRLPNGSLPVYADDHLVLKLFPPPQAAAARVEAAVLEAVSGRLPVPTPAVRAAGSRDGWRYVLMDRLPGQDLSTVWADLTREDRRRVAAQAGALTRALHEVTPPALQDWWPQDWTAFVREQRLSAAGRHHRRGLPPAWSEQVDDFLDRTPLLPGPRVLLHTEIMPANLLAVPDADGRWSLSGLCDAEPAMRGHHEYDLVALAVFLTGGDRTALREALTAYGYDATELDEDLSHRLLAWTLLHRFGDVAAFLEFLPRPDSPTLPALARSWFGLTP